MKVIVLIAALGAGVSGYAGTTQSAQGQTMADAIQKFSDATTGMLPDAYWAGAAVSCQLRSQEWGQTIVGGVQLKADDVAEKIWGKSILKDPKFTGSGDPDGGWNLTSGGGIAALMFNAQAYSLFQEAGTIPASMCDSLRRSGMLQHLDAFARATVGD